MVDILLPLLSVVEEDREWLLVSISYRRPLIFSVIMRSGKEQPPEEKELEKMALTRKSLKAMGLTEEQVESIVEMHTETVDGLKNQLQTATEKANQLDGVQKELDALKATGGDNWKEKYTQEKKAFEDYKSGILAKETRNAKEAAVLKYISEWDFDGKKISGDNLDIAMLAVSGMIDAVNLDGEKLTGTNDLDGVISGKLSRLASAETTVGVQTANPPANNGAATKPQSRAAQLEAQYHANLYGANKN